MDGNKPQQVSENGLRTRTSEGQVSEKCCAFELLAFFGTSSAMTIGDDRKDLFLDSSDIVSQTIGSRPSDSEIKSPVTLNRQETEEVNTC